MVQAEADDVGAAVQGETDADVEDLGLLMLVQTEDVEENKEEKLSKSSVLGTEVVLGVDVNVVKSLLLSAVRCMLDRL